MPQTNVIPDWKATYPADAKCQKPGGIPGTITRATTAVAWAAGTVTLTVAAVPDYVGTVVPITVSGIAPAGFNGSYQGTVASPTTITYPLASNPGAVTGQGQVAYLGIIPLSISTTLTGTDVPNKPSPFTATIQMVEAEAVAAEAEEVEGTSRFHAAVGDEDEVEVEDEEETEEDENGEPRPKRKKPSHKGHRR